MTDLAPVWKYAEVNPATPEFKLLHEGAEVSFMPLEAVWPGTRADYRNALPWASKLNYTQFRRGDILVPKITPTFEAGRTIIAEIPTELGLASTEVHVVRTNDESDPRFLQYCFQSLPFLDEGAHSLQGVGNLRRITPRFVQDHKVLNASLEAQRAIADYLDRETGEIDAMIAKMDELVATLGTRRKSIVIDSIRSHDNDFIRRLRLAASFVTGSTPAGGKDANFSDEGTMGWVTPEDLGSPMKISRFLSPAGLAQVREVPAHSILVCCIGTVGKLGYVDQVVTTNQQITAVVPRTGVDGRYLFYALAAEHSQILSEAVTTTLPIINNNRLGGISLHIPPIDQQRRIADHLDEVTGKIDAMLAKVAELKSLLIERRAALITDAVTGRKKVA